MAFTEGMNEEFRCRHGDMGLGYLGAGDAMLMTSMSKLGDATSLTARRVDEELKLQGILFHEHR